MTANATAGGAAITAGRAPRTLLELIVNQTDPTAPIRKSSLPTTPPPEWEFHTWFPHPDGGGDMVPGERQRGVLVRRLVTHGDWEPVRPDRWADESITEQPAAASAVVSPPTDQATELASLAVNAGRALHDEKRHYEIACQENARLRATIERVRRLHDALDAETDLTSPDDEITRGAAARKIAAALDGWTDPTELRRLAAEAQQQPDTETPDDEPPTEEQIVRDHVTTLHLIGEQLAEVESWMWQHLAAVRDAAAEPCLCGHAERRHRRQRAGWTREACSDCPCDDYVAAIPVQPAAADTEEPRP